MTDLTVQSGASKTRDAGLPERRISVSFALFLFALFQHFRRRIKLLRQPGKTKNEQMQQRCESVNNVSHICKPKDPQVS
jgi:hypothetical protein